MRIFRTCVFELIDSKEFNTDTTKIVILQAAPVSFQSLAVLVVLVGVKVLVLCYVLRRPLARTLYAHKQ